MSGETKKRVYVGTIGHVDRPSTTLTSALLKVLAKKYGGVTRASEGGDQATSSSRVEYSTATRHYVHIDERGRPDYVKSLFAEGSLMSGVILVVDATEGVKPHQESVLLGRKAGVQRVVVFLDKCDEADEELAELVEMEVRELLSVNDFKNDDTPVIHGSSLKALEGVAEWEEKIEDLAKALDTFITDRDRGAYESFSMPIDEVSSGSDGAVVVKGRAERGLIRVGDEVETVGLIATAKGKCSGVEVYGKLLDEGRAGENLGVHLRGIRREEVERGQVLTKPGLLRASTEFEGDAYLLSKAEGGSEKPLLSGSRAHFYFRTVDVIGVLKLAAGVDKAMPGDNVKITVTLMNPIAMEKDLRFVIRDGGRTLGAGAVTTFKV